MKFLLIAFLISTPALAFAAPLEMNYLASRDGAIKALELAEKRRVPQETQSKQPDAAMAGLETTLRRIIGPFEMKSFAGPGKINLDTLVKGDQGYGMLDGLVFASANEKTRVLVTTDVLLKAWIKAHRKWWGRKDNLPKDFSKALRLEAFYTQAISTDSAVIRYADLPVTAPAQAGPAFAMLNERAQDIGPRTPGELIVALVRGHRVFVVMAAAEVLIAPMPACVALWDAAVAQSGALYEARRDTGDKNRPSADAPVKLRDDGDAAFHRCFAERAKGEAGFAKLVAQAQAIVDALPK